MKQSCFAGLDHRYAEGADLTLTDIVLFPCLSIILVNSIDFFLLSSVLVQILFLYTDALH